MGDKNLKLIFLIFLACFITIILAGCNKNKEKATPPPPVRVEVMAVGSAGNQESRQYSGTVSPAETTTLSFSVAGTIEFLNVNEGQRVSKGQLLGKVDAGDYINAKNIAYAQLAEAQDAYNRLKKLHDANALPEVKWVEMEQKLKQAQNAAEMADRTLNDAMLHSPVNGTVSRKFVEPGQSVVPVQPIYEIVSSNKLNVEVSVSESEIGNFTVGQPATIKFDAPGIAPLQGKVSSKSVVADPLSRSYTLKIDIPDQNGKILPGMLTIVTFDSINPDSEDSLPAQGTQTDGTQHQMSQGVVLPSGTVLLNHDNRWFVWIVENNTAQRRFVEVDQLVPRGIMVKSGLTPGDSVIVSGMQKVGSGSKVVCL